MYDTINFWLTKETLGTINLFNHCEPFLSNLTTKLKDSEITSINGNLENYRINIYENGISLQGSLSKYYKGSNCLTLSRLETQKAIEKISDTLHLDFFKSKVSRLDLANDFLMEFPPESYYQFLSEAQYFERWKRKHTLYYSNTLRTKLFYNKKIQSKKEYPFEWENENVLRYEMRYMKNVSKSFQKEVSAKTLHNENFYAECIKRYVAEFHQIPKVSIFDFDLLNVKSPKDFTKQMALSHLSQIGQLQALQLVKELRALQAFSHAEYYSRLRTWIKSNMSNPKHSKDSPLILELNEKIESVKR